MSGDTNPALAVQNKAWDVKDICDDLLTRTLGAKDLAALESVLRDLERLAQKLIGIRDRRKRGGS